MTGPEHYKAAEELLGQATLSGRVHPDYEGDAERQIAAAQVHATLALAAATASTIFEAHADGTLTSQTADPWREGGAL